MGVLEEIQRKGPGIPPPSVPDYFNLAVGASGQIILKAVVVEVIFDPAQLISPAPALQPPPEPDPDTGETDDKQKGRLGKKMTDRILLEGAPRNSIVVRLVGNAAAHMAVDSDLLCYPLFPPHLCLPVKAGEQVLIIDPTPGSLSDIMYWICRAPQPDYVDDLNFTHGDRVLMESPFKMEFDEDETPPEKPGFENGQGTEETWTLPEIEDMPGPYDEIFTGSLANKAITLEPVPRFTKRPGDLALQGSNNTLICLGEDRGYSPLKPPTDISNANFIDMVDVKIDGMASLVDMAKAETRIGRGTIDIVAGRGQTREAVIPSVTSNTRDFDEVNKNPVNFPAPGSVPDNQADKPMEGDPDLKNDLSRVYVSMKTNGDANFDLAYPEFAGSQVSESPYVMVKSTEVRIIGRKDGSVRIVKEGTEGDDQCVITLLSDGTVAIDAKKIRIGDGRNNQVYLGENATEKLVRGDMLVKVFEKFKDDFMLDIDTALGPLGASPIIMPLLGVTLDTLIAGIKSALSPVSKTK